MDNSRFFSGDMEYIQSVLLSLIESVGTEKKHILKDVLIVAQTYGVDRSKVQIYYFLAMVSFFNVIHFDILCCF